MAAGATRDRDELLAFELGLDERVCDEVREEAWGRLYLTPSLPLIWDANWCAIEAPGLSFAEVAAIAEEALGGEGFGHRAVAILDQAEGRRVAAEFEAERAHWIGWELERDRYMVWRGAAAVSSHFSPHSGEKCERSRRVGLAEIEPLRRGIITEEAIPAGVPRPRETAAQLLELDRRYGEAGGDLWFAAPAAGEPLSCCRLLRDGDGIAQVEDVGTRAHARDRGFAKANVRAAIAAARASGDATIFLIADAADWPQLLYGRLGFETVGELVVLRRRP